MEYFSFFRAYDQQPRINKKDILRRALDARADSCNDCKIMK